MALVLMFVLLNPGSGLVGFNLLFGLAFFASVPAVILFYYSIKLLAASRTKPTPGQKAVGLALEYRQTEQRTRSTLIRNVLLGPVPLLVLFILGLWPLMLVPLLLPLLTRDSRYPGDHLAGITVVSAE
jgi:hypothetical protein